VLAAGCGSGNQVATSTPTVASTSPSPAALCGTTSHPCLALVTLHSGDFVVADVSDASRPTTVAHLGPVSWPVFLGSTEVSFLADGSLYRAPLLGGSRTLVLKADDLMAFAWSPDASTVAYLVPSGSGTALHLLSGGSDRVVEDSLPARPAVGCETEFCAVADTWDFRLTYSPDGKYISLVESIAQVNSFRLWTANGTLLEHSDSQARAMSVWTGVGFYFQDATGVEVWRAGVVSRFLPGVTWIRPSASANGREIVYATRDAGGMHHTFVADTTNAQVRDIKAGRGAPLFVSPEVIWYAGERACATADNCPAGYHYLGSGKDYVYDLRTGTESDSGIDFINDVWPHAA
jgi:hypothetical protein